MAQIQGKDLAKLACHWQLGYQGKENGDQQDFKMLNNQPKKPYIPSLYPDTVISLQPSAPACELWALVIATTQWEKSLVITGI